jgi:2'-5' RNA ligase
VDVRSRDPQGGVERSGALTRLAIVAYPELADADRSWIDSVRSQHDPQATRIGAHFTLVFPAAMALDSIVEHVSAVALRTEPIPFVLRGVLSVADAFASGGHVFLVPDEGRAAIAALHDLLYGGPIRAFLRDDLPFVPHVTVAAASDLARCEELRREVAREMPAIQGTLGAVDVVEIADDGIRTAGRFQLLGK